MSATDLYNRVLSSESDRSLLLKALERVPLLDDLGRGLMVIVKRYRPKRSDEQSATMWTMLNDLAEQRTWHVDGELKYITAEDWKDIATAGLKKNQHIAQGIEGGFVMLGQRTRDMSVSDMYDLIEFLSWFGSQEPGGQKQIVWRAYPPDPLKSKKNRAHRALAQSPRSKPR